MTMGALLQANDTNFCPSAISDFFWRLQHCCTTHKILYLHCTLATATIFVYDRVRDIQTFAFKRRKENKLQWK